MNTPSQNTPANTTKITATPSSTYRQPHRCLISNPKDGSESNFLVKYTTKENTFIYFWMTKSGEFLKMSSKDEWDACCQKWIPKPTAVLLPIAQIANAKKIEAFMKECESKGVEISKETWDAMIAEKTAKSEAIKADVEKQIAKKEKMATIKADILSQYEKRMKKIELRKEIEAAAEFRKNNPVVKKPGLREVITEINHRVEPTLLGEAFANVLSKVQTVKEKKVRVKKENSIKKPVSFKKTTPKKKTSPRKKVA